MSQAFTDKIVDIIYFLVPTAIILISIIFWEKNFGKSEAEKSNKEDHL